jgi:hypothetical protein
MEIIATASLLTAVYVILRAHVAHVAGEKKPRVVAPGDRIQYHESVHPADIVGAIKLGRVIPADLPTVARYRARRPCSVRVGGKIETFAIGEVVELHIATAWEPLLCGDLEPVDSAAWSPARLTKEARQRRK